MPATQSITIDAHLNLTEAADALEALGRELQANGLALVATAERLRTRKPEPIEHATQP